MGRVTGLTANANTYSDYSYTFPTAYASAPAMTATMISASTAASMSAVELALNEISATGFSIRLFNNSTTARAPAFYWIAIGIV